VRELTRYRKTQIDARTHEIQRLEKVLQEVRVVSGDDRPASKRLSKGTSELITSSSLAR
jgi:hypothetical protein